MSKKKPLMIDGLWTEGRRLRPLVVRLQNCDAAVEIVFEPERHTFRVDRVIVGRHGVTSRRPIREHPIERLTPGLIDDIAVSIVEAIEDEHQSERKYNLIAVRGMILAAGMWFD